MARTRANGQELTVNGLIEDLYDLVDYVDEAALREFCRDLRALAVLQFDKGFALGASIEHRVAVEAVQQLALTVLGKDRGDGAIDLGALGSPVYKEA